MLLNQNQSTGAHTEHVLSDNAVNMKQRSRAVSLRASLICFGFSFGRIANSENLHWRTPQQLAEIAAGTCSINVRKKQWQLPVLPGDGGVRFFLFSCVLRAKKNEQNMAFN